MRPSEIFNTLLDKVSEVCEIKRESILNGSRIQAVVDARVLLVQYLRRIGLNDDDIALQFMRAKAGDNKLCPPIDEVKKKAKSIAKTFSLYSERCLQSYAFCLESIEIKAFCRDTYKGLYGYGMKELPE